jgi:hypothetical protein
MCHSPTSFLCPDSVMLCLTPNVLWDSNAINCHSNLLVPLPGFSEYLFLSANALSAVASVAVSFPEKFDAMSASKSLKVVKAMSSNGEHHGTG